MIDYPILGGDSAGCFLVARLSERPELKVVLVEAGRDISLECVSALKISPFQRAPAPSFLSICKSRVHAGVKVGL
jgi:choline dehydrogenase-like flavoprotein